MTEKLNIKAVKHRHAILGQPVASLLGPMRDTTLWGEKVVSNAKLDSLAFRRRELVVYFDYVFGRVADVTTELSDALDAGTIDEAKVSIMFDKLADFLEEESYSERLLLYLPFELLPHRGWKPKSQALIKALDRFMEIYRRKWFRLLERRDIRANFVDGDIPEDEIRTGPLPLVVKATHMIPILIDKGIIGADEVRSIAERSSDPFLSISLREALGVPLRKRDERLDARSACFGLFDIMMQAAFSIDAARKRHSALGSSKPPARIAWELKMDVDAIISEHSLSIAIMIASDPRSCEKLRLLAVTTADESTLRVIVRGFRATVESFASQSMMMARIVYSNLERALETIALRPHGKELDEELQSAWSRLAVIGVVDAETLRRHGLRVPHLDGSDIFEDPASVKECVSIGRTIASEPGLSEFLLPVTIEYGSRIKGYNASGADWDVAVFIKPGVSMTKRTQIQILVEHALRKRGINGKALEFWLEEHDGDLWIRDFPAPDRSLGDSTLSHVLFLGVWSGDTETVRELHRRLLSSYLRPQGKMVLDQPAQEVWLEELERDALQFRLMHSGYKRFYPEQRSAWLPDSDIIDSQSTFWDPGYRRLASKLFMQKVFLPDLEA